MPIDISELEPIQAESEPRKGLRVEELEAAEQPAVPQAAAPLAKPQGMSLEETQLLMPPEGDKIPLSTRAAQWADDLIMGPRALLAGTEQTMLRAPLQAAGGQGAIVGTVRDKLDNWAEDGGIGGTLARSGSIALAPAEVGLKALGRFEEWLQEKNVWLEQSQEPGMIEGIYHGLGQAAGFAGVGVGAKLAGLPVTVAPTVLGAVQQGGAGYRDAVEHGATQEEQAISTIANSMLGMTEGASWGYLLNRMNRATGGKLWDVMERVGGVNANPTAVREALMGFATEFAQEGFQTWGENVIASDVAKYDPDRVAGDNVWKSALIGGVVGGLVGGAGGAYGQVRAREERAKADEAFATMNALFPQINSIGGKFTPLGMKYNGEIVNLLESQIEWDRVNEQLQQKEGDALQAMLGQNVPDLAAKLRVPAENAELLYTGADLVYAPQAKLPLSEELHPDLKGQVDENGQPLTAYRVLTDTNKKIAYTHTGFRLGLIAGLEAQQKLEQNQLISLQATLANEQAVKNPNLQQIENLKVSIKAQEVILEEHKRLIKKHQIARKAYLQYMKRAGEISHKIAQIMGYPDAKILVSTLPTEEDAEASAGLIQDAVDSKGNPITVFKLNLSTAHGFDQLYPESDATKRVTKEDRKRRWLMQYEYIVHESGHHFQMRVLKDLYAAYNLAETLLKGQATTAQELEQAMGKEQLEKAKAYAAILIDYRNFLNAAHKSKLHPSSFMVAQRGLAQSLTRGTNQSAAGPIRFLDDPSYTFSFDEYVAHRFERAAASAQVDAMGTPQVTQELNRVMNKHFFSKYFGALQGVLSEIMTTTDPISPEPGNLSLRAGVMHPLGKNNHALDLAIRRIIVGKEISDVREMLAQSGGAGRLEAIKDLVPGMDPKGWAGLQLEYDKFTWVMKYFFNLQQIARENPHITGLQKYLNSVQNLWAPYSRHTYDRANQTINKWRRLGKEGGNKVTTVLMEESEDGAMLPPAMLAKKLNDQELDVYYSVRRDLDFMLNEMQRVAEQQARSMITYNAGELATRLEEIQKSFQDMRGKGYFPYMRFGKNVLTVRAAADLTLDGKKYKKNQLISWESFDQKSERTRANKLWRQKHPELIIAEQARTDMDYSTQGLPTAFLRSLKESMEASINATTDKDGNPTKVTASQRTAMEQINQAIVDNLPTKSFKRQFLRKRGIKGFSMDFQRSYAAYMRMGAAHISRVEFSPLMAEAIKEVQEDLKLATFKDQSNADARSRMLSWMQQHYDYIMNPGNELQTLRAAGFFWFLGFNVKSAALNLFQIPMVGLPYLGDRFGDLQSVGALANAQKEVVQYWKNRDAWTAETKTREQRRFMYAQLAKIPVLGQGTGELPSVENTQPVTSSNEALAVQSRGGRVFLLSEMDEELTEITDRPDIIKRTAPDLLFVLQPHVVASTATEMVFDLDGASKDFNISDGGRKFYDLTRLNILNLNQPEATLKLLLARLQREKRELMQNKQLIADLEQAIAEQQVSNGPITRIEFGLYRLADVMQELDYDGVVTADPMDPDVSSQVVLMRKLDKAQEITQDQANVRMHVKPGRKGELVKMLQHLQHMGITDQSLAQELAIAASENKADRLAPINAAERLWYNVSSWGALPFHVTEKLNRQVMAIAAYNLARDKGLTERQATEEAIQAVNMSMYEYANWNRPVFMRGKKSAVFLFMNYVQNTAYFAMQGNKAALRFWLMMAMLAGIEGLPFAKDLMELIDFAVTQLNEVLGVKNPKFVMRHELREMLQQMTDNPDLFMHGFGQDSFGLSFMSQLVGIPFPSIDMASSIGMGDIIPGTNIPGLVAERGFREAPMAALQEFGGAGGTAGAQMFTAMFSDQPDKWKQVEKMLPVFAKNASQAVRWGVRGEERTATGEVVAEFDPFNPRGMMELGGKALGFQPTKVTRGWESIIAEREIVEYYRRQQAQVLKNYAYNFHTGDREGLADANKNWQEFNRIVPYPEMQITGDMLKSSVEQYVKSQALTEAGVSKGPKYLRLQEEVRGTYESPRDVDTAGNE